MTGKKQKIHFWTTEDKVKQIEDGIDIKYLLDINCEDLTKRNNAKKESRAIFIRTACEEECERYSRPFKISLFRHTLWKAIEEEKDDFGVYYRYLRFKRDTKNYKPLYGYFSACEESEPKLCLPLPYPTTPDESTLKKKFSRGSKAKQNIKQEHIDVRVSEELKASIKNICYLKGMRECDFIIRACENRLKQLGFLKIEGPFKKRIKALIAIDQSDYWLMKKIWQYRLELKSKICSHYYYYKVVRKQSKNQNQILDPESQE